MNLSKSECFSEFFKLYLSNSPAAMIHGFLHKITGLNKGGLRKRSMHVAVVEDVLHVASMLQILGTAKDLSDSPKKH